EAFSPMLLTLKKQEEALASEVEKLLSAAIQDKSTYEKAYQHLLPWIKTCNSELDSTSRQSLLKQLVEELEACGHDAKKVEQVMEKIQTHQPTSTGLSLYKALYKVVPPKTAAQYYFALVPLVTRVIKKKLTISSIDKQIHPMIDKIVSPLTGNKIKINEVVKKFVRQIENASSIEKDWQHFLQTGTLRAQYTSPHVLLNAFVEHASPKTKLALKHLLQASSARKRIVAYFSDSDLRKLVPIIEEKAHQQITTCIYTMLKLHHHTPLQIASKQDFRNVWWEVILQKLAETDRFLQETWLAESLLALADTLQLNPRTLLYSFVTTAKEILPATQERANLQMSQLAANLSALIENKEASIQKDLLSTTHKTLATIVEELEQAGSVASPLDNKKEKQKQPPALEKLTPKQEEPEEIKIYIQNGGIIFLWPFLEKLFEAQGLLEEGAFIDEITLNNAIHTMEYMATGRLYTPEEVLALNKILCGLTHDTVISSRYILREEEDTPEKGEKEDRQEATETSAEALQEEETEEKDKVTKTDASQERTTDEQTPIVEKQQPEEGNTTQTKEKLPEEIIRLQKQCAQTIESVMEQWESLEELEEFKEYEEGFTAEDFKAYILKRQGILRKIKEGETHYWHLSLAIKTYDSRELKPPWRIEKIKLPWMKETLVVFWIPG
ncbi:MAG: hypothetical protein MI674_03320, partial [Cytophagales bacterium]|nr:hypothetical protein [Cytophagales bacterium]